MKYFEDFKKGNQQLINTFGEDNAYLAWVMALSLDRDDVIELATASITDGNDDKKIDFIDLDESNGTITFAQGYYSNGQSKDSAKANKASDLNTAIAWLWSGDLDLIPKTLRSIISACRDAISNDLISIINIAYVHNLPESVGVRNELQTLKKHFAKLAQDNGIEVVVQEYGIENVIKLYESKHSPIFVKDQIEMDGILIPAEQSNDWTAFVGTVSGKWLHNLFEKYSNDLFSANYRGFLGTNKRKKINNKIKSTAESASKNFWAFNNGITVLTRDVNTESNPHILDGISIINGAQTTGSIGSIDNKFIDQLEDVKVLCRVIKCSDPVLIRSIVAANNTQNAITSWDMYSNAPEQSRILEEFKKYNHSYSLKRGFDNANAPLGIYSVAQPTLAFEGDFSNANRGKNSIFESPHLYNAAFEDKKARHLLLAYSLSKTIEAIKIDLKYKYATGKINDIDENKYILLCNLKFKMLFIALLGSTFQSIMGESINITTIAFSPACAKNPIYELVNRCRPVVEQVFNLLTTQIEKYDPSTILPNSQVYSELNKNLNALVSSMRSMPGFKESFDLFKSYITLS